MNAFSRRGACPALSAPMETGDGLLVRLNLLAGGFSPKTLIGLCEAASRHGNGVVEVTARGSFQIRGLTEESALLLARDVNVLGIPVRAGVPVETGPLAGLDLDEIADARPLAERIRRAIAIAGLEGKLGPKVSVVVDGGGHSALDEVTADVRLTAERAGRKVLWRVAVAGDAEASQPVAKLAEDAACEAAIHIVAVVAALGRHARARDLPPDALAGIGSPQQAGGAKERGHLLGILALNDSRCALGIALPFGHTGAETLIAFSRQAEAQGVSETRLAPKRTVLALCPSQASAATLQRDADHLGLVTFPTDPRRSIAACPGAPACASGHIAAREIAASIAAKHGHVLDGSFTLHVSGCAKGCAHPAEAAFTLVGSENGAGIVVAGTARGAPLAYTAPKDVAAGFGRLAALMRRGAPGGSATSLATPGETEIAAAFQGRAAAAAKGS